jgi:hypothetical protein
MGKGSVDIVNVRSEAENKILKTRSYNFIIIMHYVLLNENPDSLPGNE